MITDENNIYVTVEYANREWGAYDHVVHARVYKELRQQFDAANALINKHREETTSVCRHLAAARVEIAELRRQVTLLRDALIYEGELCKEQGMSLDGRSLEALDATKEQ